MNLRSVHRYSALVVATYAVMHITNHLLGFAGTDIHLEVMAALRHVYRFRPFEFLLLAAVGIQVATGLWMFFAGLRARRGAVAWVQALSGLTLSGFLALHLTAIFYGRLQLHLDTNIFYAAAGMQLPGPRTFFGPYYFAGVLALFVHAGCALYRLRLRKAARTGAGTQTVSARKWIGLWSLAGGLVASAIVLLLAGAITPVDVPAVYLETFKAK